MTPQISDDQFQTTSECKAEIFNVKKSCLLRSCKYDSSSLNKHIGIQRANTPLIYTVRVEILSTRGL